MEVPAPAPDVVSAARRHLTDRFARGVERLLWETDKRPLADTDAVKFANEAAIAGHAEPMDVAAALVSVHAARLHLDRMEYEVLQAAEVIGITDEAIAAVLDLSGEQAVGTRRRWLARRYRLPHAEPDPVSLPGVRQ